MRHLLLTVLIFLVPTITEAGNRNVIISIDAGQVRWISGGPSGTTFYWEGETDVTVQPGQPGDIELNLSYGRGTSHVMNATHTETHDGSQEEVTVTWQIPLHNGYAFIDTDGDGEDDRNDSDDDGDGIPDTQDIDVDGDGIYNNYDSEWPLSYGNVYSKPDSDRDGITNDGHNDDDADGRINAMDFAPNDPNVQDDPGGGGGGGSDNDHDNDGICNECDAQISAPLNPGYDGSWPNCGPSSDQNGDGICESCQNDPATDDQDCDGVPNGCDSCNSSALDSLCAGIDLTDADGDCVYDCAECAQYADDPGDPTGDDDGDGVSNECDCDYLGSACNDTNGDGVDDGCDEDCGDCCPGDEGYPDCPTCDPGDPGYPDCEEPPAEECDPCEYLSQILQCMKDEAEEDIEVTAELPPDEYFNYGNEEQPDGLEDPDLGIEIENLNGLAQGNYSIALPLPTPNGTQTFLFNTHPQFWDDAHPGIANVADQIRQSFRLLALVLVTWKLAMMTLKVLHAT